VSTVDLLIAGARGGTNVGQSLYEGAERAGYRAMLLDTKLAMQGPYLLTKLKWHLMGHRPVRLSRFSAEVVDTCARVRPRFFVSVGIAPVKAAAVRALRAQGVQAINYLTDDPWNPGHRSRWALAALREYDRIASPRRANMPQLAALGRPEVRYVPFGYDPSHCFPEPADRSLASDVIFVGGADADRVPWVHRLVAAGLKVALYGSYWDRFPPTRGVSRGQAGPDVIRRATSVAKLALCLVRRANRDGHVMRSLEIAAIGACMLVEDTDEHRALFGPDGEAVVYFRTPDEMVARAQWLLGRDEERSRLARAVHALITEGPHSYADRLSAMLAER